MLYWTPTYRHPWMMTMYHFKPLLSIVFVSTFWFVCFVRGLKKLWSLLTSARHES